MKAISRSFAWWTVPLVTLASCAVIVAVLQAQASGGEPEPADSGDYGPSPGGKPGPWGPYGAMCYDQYACNQIDVPAPFCDPVGWKTCSDYVSVDYNPNNKLIQVAAQSAECTKYHGRMSGKQVLCSIGRWYDESDTVIILSLCSGDPPAACVGAPPPFWCHLCDVVHQYPTYVENQECMYDSMCCEPEQVLP